MITIRSLIDPLDELLHLQPRPGGSPASAQVRSQADCLDMHVVAVRRSRGDSVQRLFGPRTGWQGELVLGDVQYPTLWLPVGLIAVVVVGAAVWPGERLTRVVVAIALITAVIIGYIVLPQVFDVDQLIRG